LGYSLGSIRNIVIHLISAQRRWLCRLREAPLAAHLPFEAYPSRKLVRLEWQVAREECLQYLASLTSADLAQAVTYTIANRCVETSTTRWEILVHLVNHATDHRSQILALLNSQFGIATPEHDFIIYLWERGGQ
jgi:uncharacterized damage-inducible protein DinB